MLNSIIILLLLPLGWVTGILFHEIGHYLAARICRMPVNEIQFGFENKWFELKIRNLTVKIYKDFYRGGSVNIFAEKHPPISYILIALAGPFVNLAFLEISFILYKGLDVTYAFSFVIVNLILLGIAVSDYYLASFAFKQIRKPVLSFEGLRNQKNE